MGGGEVLKKGVLIKSPPLDSGALKMWRRRWFVLLSSKVLEYYKSEGGEQKGVINLEDCHSVNSNLSHKRYKHVFNIETKERVYFMVAKSQSDMESWVDALCRVCGLHNDNTAMFHTLPPSASSKIKGPNITQPIYATSTRGTSYTSSGQLSNPVESVYSLAAKSDYGVGRRLQKHSFSDLPSAPVSEDVPPRAHGSNWTAVTTRGSDEGIGGNRLSETEFFSPRASEGIGFLAEADPVSGKTPTGYNATSGHKVVGKARSATLAPSLGLVTPSGLEYRSHTNAVVYSGGLQQPAERVKISNGSMSTTTVGQSTSGTPFSAGMNRLPEPSFDPPFATLDSDSAAREGGYGVLHMPPAIDRSNKPPQQFPEPLAPVIDRGLKPGGQRVEPDSPDSSEEDSPRHTDHWSVSAYSKLTEEDSSGCCGGGETGKEEHETQFSVAEMPQVTVRTTHYTQVDIDPSKRRPVPLPRKTSALSSLAPKPSQRISYADVDIQATNQLSDHLHRQMTVREAERKALSEKHYINVDHSGFVDDETDPDYYTHMRDLNFDEADTPDTLSQEMQDDDTDF